MNSGGPGRNEWVKAITEFKEECVEKMPQEAIDMDIANMKAGSAAADAAEAAADAEEGAKK